MKASTKIQPKPSQKFPIWLLFIIGAGILLVAVVVIVSARAATSPVAPLVTGGPALQVDKEKVDLGTIALGNTIDHTTVAFPMMMHEGIGGYHDFRLHLPTNVRGQTDKTVQILSNWQ